MTIFLGRNLWVSLTLSVLMNLTAISVYAADLPTGGVVKGGAANGTISQSDTQMTVNQFSQNMIANFTGYSIGAGKTVIYNQPNSSALALNRVTGVDPSIIAGNLRANGQVILVNPNGVLFTPGAHVNVGSLVATTSNISDANAMAGTLIFDQPSSSKTASIVNEGTITAAEGGLVALVAPSVANKGKIIATLGRVSLAAGNKWTLDLYGDRLVKFAVDDSIAQQVTVPDGTPLVAGIDLTGGSIDAAKVEITTGQAVQIVNNAVNTGPALPMSGFVNSDGTITIAQTTQNTGEVIFGGVVTDFNSETSGGNITISSDSSNTITPPITAIYGGTINPTPGTILYTGSVRYDALAASTGPALKVSAGVIAASFTPHENGITDHTMQLAIPRTSSVSRVNFQPNSSSALNLNIAGIDGAAQPYCVKHCDVPRF